MNRLFSLCLALLLAACASLPRTIDITLKQLEAAFARKLPQPHRMFDILDVRLAAPRVTLLPESSRLRVDVSVTASDRFLRQPVAGDAAFSFGVRWEPADATIRLAEVRVERLDLEGLPQPLRGHLQRLGTALGAALLEGVVLHQFSAAQLEKAQGYTPGEIRVTPDALRITLQPPAH